MNTSKSTAISPALTPYEPFYERILPTGSRVMVDPPPQDTDEDYLVLVTPLNLVVLEDRLLADGWNLGGSLPNQGVMNGEWILNTEHEFKTLEDGSHVIDHSRVFHSWKRQETPTTYIPVENSFLNSVVEGSGPEINLLVTCNDQYFNDFTRATFLCQALNLTDKADRVTVFEALTRDVWPTGPKKKKHKSNLMFRGIPITFVDSVFYGDGTNNGADNFTGLQTIVNPPIVTENNQWFDQNGNPIPATVIGH